MEYNQKKLPLLERISYTFSAFSYNFWSTFISTFLLYFYTDVIGIRPAVAGLIISSAVIWDAINDPLFAAVVDNHRFKNGDKMRPFLIWASIPLALLFVLLFVQVGEGTVSVVAAFVTYFLFKIPSTFNSITTGGMIKVATPVTEQRINICQFFCFGAIFGAAFSALVMWPMVRAISGVDENNNMINPKYGFFIAAVIVAVVIVAVGVFQYFCTKERIHSEKVDTISIRKACGLLFKQKNYLRVLCMAISYGLLITLAMTYGVYYCDCVINQPDLFTPMSAVYILGSLIMLPFVGKLHTLLGRNKMLLLGSAVLSLGSIVFIVLAKSALGGFVFFFCVGCGTQMINIMLSLNNADLTDIIEFREGERLDSLITTITSFFDKSVEALLTLLLGIVLEACHYDGLLDRQPDEAITAIICIIGVGTLLCAMLTFLLSRRFTLDDQVREMNEAKTLAKEAE